MMTSQSTLYWEVSQKLVEKVERFAPMVGVEPTGVSIRSFKSRWGSCQPPDQITLNLKLMQVPKVYIDYVIMHELCHLKEYNHSRRFYALLNRVLPDWKEKRERLNALEVS